MLKLNLTNKRKQKKSKATDGRNIRSAPVLYQSVPVIRKNQIHSFRRAVTRSIYWNPFAGLDGFASAYTLQLNFSPGETNYRFSGTSIYTDALPSVSEFSNLYDQWRIKDVIIRIDYTTDIYANSGVAFTPPLLLYAADYDDPGDAPVASMLQLPQTRTHCFMTNGYRPLIMGITPRPLRDVAGSGLLTTYSPMEQNPWLRTTELSAPHYGIKIALQGNGASSNSIIGYFQVTVWYDLEFTNPK